MSSLNSESGPGILDVAREARVRFADVPANERSRLSASLRDDMVTEYDARFLVEYIDSLNVPLGVAFRRTLKAWYRDEVRHFSSFRCVVETCLDEAGVDLEAREPDFSLVEHLFPGEFEILCLLAYDELATLRGYRGNLPLYDRLGSGLGQHVRRVIADEAGHYADFRALLVEHHRHRLAEVPEVVRRIRATEGTPYRATFVLDHDDPVYGDHIFDDAARILVSQMQRCSERPSA